MRHSHPGDPWCAMTDPVVAYPSPEGGSVVAWTRTRHARRRHVGSRQHHFRPHRQLPWCADRYRLGSTTSRDRQSTGPLWRLGTRGGGRASASLRARDRTDPQPLGSGIRGLDRNIRSQVQSEIDSSLVKIPRPYRLHCRSWIHGRRSQRHGSNTITLGLLGFLRPAAWWIGKASNRHDLGIGLILVAESGS